MFSAKRLLCTSLLILSACTAFLPAFSRGEGLEGMGGGLKGIGGMGGGMKGVGGMGGGFKGVGGMGGGFKGVGGMGGGMRGLGDAGGGFENAKEHYYDGRYGGYSMRYGENNPRYGGTEEMNETTRYGVTTGRYGEPVDASVDNSLAARYDRAQMYRNMMGQIATAREAGGAPPVNQGYLFNRMRQLEEHPPTSFNHIYY
jgi:hypothetical protein